MNAIEVAQEQTAPGGIFEHFSGAYHLGLTATPREDRDVSTQTYFGEPLFQYSYVRVLKMGFLHHTLFTE